MDERKYAVAAAVVAGLAAVSLTAYWLWPGGADIADAPSVDDAGQAVEYVASDEFSKLGDKDKQEYVEKLAKSGGEGPPRGLFAATTQMSDEARGRFRKQFGPVMRRMMMKRINDYFDLPKDQRAAEMDKIIDGFEARRAEAPKDRPPGGPRGMTPERLKKILENTEPEMRARFVEFRKDMETRRKQRGLPPGFGRSR